MASTTPFWRVSKKAKRGLYGTILFGFKKVAMWYKQMKGDPIP
jgi:hypothetical protein